MLDDLASTVANAQTQNGKISNPKALVESLETELKEQLQTMFDSQATALANNPALQGQLETVKKTMEAGLATWKDTLVLIYITNRGTVI